MNANLNIGCAVRDCSNPVIGQCSGYSQPCGRYYCADHSMANFCSDCAYQKTEHEIYTDYLQTAEKVKQDATPWGHGCFRSMTSILIGLGIFAFALSVVAAFLMLLTSARGITMEILCIPILVGGSIGLYVLGYLYQSSQVRQRARAKAAVINQTKPGFLEFFEAWDSNKPKDDLVELLTVGGIFAVGMLGATVAAALSSSDKAGEEERIRNAVNNELRRRGLD